MPVSHVVPPDDFATLCKVIAATGRRGALSDDDAREFAQWVHLTLLERDYAPLARFSGRSSLHTYLTVVVRRLLLDWRNMAYGKWRPSRSARRRGPEAVAFDRLVKRDGHTVEEALSILRSRDVDETLLMTLTSIPTHCRPRMVSHDEIDDIVTAVQFIDPIEQAEERSARSSMVQLLRRASKELAPSDRQLIHLRFARGLSVVAIAAQMGVPAKPLYRRISRILQSLRRRIATGPQCGYAPLAGRSCGSGAALDSIQ